MDEDGYAHFSAIENLAGRARVSIEDAQMAVETLLAPDSNSANPDNEGRRIERVPGGFLILNHKAHRQLGSREHQRQQTRERVTRHRAKLKQVIAESVTPRYNPLQPACAYASASESGFRGEYEGREQLKTKIAPVLDDALKWLATAKENGADYTEKETRGAFLCLTAGGWKWGKRDIADWRAALERQIQSDRDRLESASPQLTKGALRPMDIKTIIAAKDDLSKDLRASYAEEDGNWGARWKDPAKKQEYVTLRKEIKSLKTQLSNMANL